DADAAPACDQEVPKFATENTDAQTEQEWHDPASPAGAPNAQVAENVHLRTQSPPSVFGPAAPLERLCGDFGQQVMSQGPCHMVNGQRFVDILRFRCGVAALGGIERGLDQSGN